jgi:hypothetical protein
MTPDAQGRINLLPDGERVYFISNPALRLWALPGL